MAKKVVPLTYFHQLPQPPAPAPALAGPRGCPGDGEGRSKLKASSLLTPPSPKCHHAAAFARPGGAGAEPRAETRGWCLGMPGRGCRGRLPSHENGWKGRGWRKWFYAWENDKTLITSSRLKWQTGSSEGCIKHQKAERGSGA